MNLIIRNRLTALAGLLIVILAVTGMASLFQPIHPDEAIFLRVAREIKSGHLPYTTLTDNKPPGIYLTLALLDIFFGDQIWIYRLTFLAISIIGAFFIYLTGRKLFTNGIGLVGAWIYLVLIVYFHGTYAITEPPVATITAVIIWLLARNWKDLNGKIIFLLGVLAALATAFKQPAVSLVIMILLVLSYGINNNRFLLKRWGWFGLGFGLIWVITAAVFETQGALIPMIRASVTDNLSQYPPGSVVAIGLFLIFRIIIPTMGIVGAIIWGIINRVPANPRYWGYIIGMILIVPWLLYRPYHHYWVLIIPLVVLWLMDIFFTQFKWIKIVIINGLVILLLMFIYSLNHLII